MSIISKYFSSPAAPTLFPATAIGLFIFSHAALSTRFVKMGYGIDHNADPRKDLDKYGPIAVSKGKMTQEDLDRMSRQQSAHQNAVENLPVFLATMVFAHWANLPNTLINKLCLVYTVARLAHAWFYVNTNSHAISYVRSLAWWTGNFVNFVALYKAGSKLNAGL